MMEQRWIGNVRYTEYTPTTIEYDHDLDAYTMARADIFSGDRRYHLTLVIVVTEGQMIVHRPGLEQAIRQGRVVLERLIAENVGAADHLTANVWRVYTLGGVRLR